MNNFIIKLKNKTGSISPKETVILSKNELIKLSFELPELYNKPQKYLITLKINNLSKDYTITKQEFEVPVEFMRVGKLLISFSVLSCGEIVKTWTCEPLILKSSNVLAEDWLEISPLLNDMKNVYDEKIAKLEENNLLLTNAILEIQKNINKRGEIL